MTARSRDPDDSNGQPNGNRGISRRDVLVGAGSAAVGVVAGAGILASRPTTTPAVAPVDSTSVKADTVLVNGQVLTVDSAFTIAEAIAVRDGVVMAVGTTADIERLVGPNTKRIDLKGNTVSPGLIDAHAHLDREGLKYQYPSLERAKSIEDILQIVDAEVKKTRPGEWVVTMPVGGQPYYLNNEPGVLKEERFPNRYDLDKVSPNNPVYIRGIWGFWNKPPILSAANSYALKLAGITSSTPSPHPQITIMKDANGDPTGVFSESASVPAMEFSLMKMVPRFTHEMRVKGVKDAMRRYNAVGTTSIFEGHGIASEIVRAYKELWAKGEMTVRSYLVSSPPPGKTVAELDEMFRDWAVNTDGPGFGDGMLRVGGVHLQSGGDAALAKILQSQAPYTAWASYYYTSFTTAQWNELLELAAKYGLRVVGSLSSDAALTQLEAIDKKYPIKDRRWSIQHASNLTTRQLQRIKALGLVPQTLVAGIAETGSETLKSTPKEQWGEIRPYRKIMEAGVPLAVATDNVPPPGFYHLWITIARKDENTDEVVVPEQRLSREQALRTMTINGAYLTFDEKIKGSLEKGKFADLIVLEQDYLKMPEDAIKDLRPVLTMVGGKVVYEK
jgi:predicted amidohydrolase YtcJ